MSASSIFAWADGAEHRMCLIANAACRRRALRVIFRTVSRLGDGVFWYALIATMPLWVGLDDPRCSVGGHQNLSSNNLTILQHKV